MAHNCKSPWQPNGLQFACHFCYLYCNYKPKKFNIVLLTRMITTNPINKKTSTTELIIDSQWIWKSSDYNKLIKKHFPYIAYFTMHQLSVSSLKTEICCVCRTSQESFCNLTQSVAIYVLSRSLFVIRLWQR